MTRVDELTRDQRDRPQAVLYARCASGMDGWSAIAAQLRACRQLADELDLSTARAFVDRGVSGLQLERPGLGRLLTYIKAHPVDYVICADASRLSRSLEQFHVLAERLQADEALLITVDEAIDRYPVLAKPNEGGSST